MSEPLRCMRCAVIPTEPHVPLTLRRHDATFEDNG
jgi:hypothetical protein